MKKILLTLSLTALLLFTAGCSCPFPIKLPTANRR